MVIADYVLALNNVLENLYIHCTLTVALITRKYKHIRNMICKWQLFPGKVLLSQFCCLFQPEIGSFKLQHSSWWLGGRYLCTVVRFASGNMAMRVTDSFDEVKLSWRNTDKSAGPAGWQPHDTSLAGSKGQTLPPHSPPNPMLSDFFFLFPRSRCNIASTCFSPARPVINLFLFGQWLNSHLYQSQWRTNIWNSNLGTACPSVWILSVLFIPRL